MDKSLSIIDRIDVGVIILNDEMKISYANNFILRLLNYSRKEIINQNIYEILPNLNTSYIRKVLQDSLHNGSKTFLSAALHKNVVDADHNFNIKISRFKNEGSYFLLLELIDVTSQFIQINRLRASVTELSRLNKLLKDKEKIIENMAFHDCLTGINNRTFFYQTANKYLEIAKQDNKTLGIMFIDINKFKMINDTYGHEIGDKALVQMAQLLTNVIKNEGIVARYGGDEFLILLPNISTYKDFKVIASKIINHPDRFLNISGQEIELSVSIGFSLYPTDGDNINKLIHKADQVMYANKKTKQIRDK